MKYTNDQIYKLMKHGGHFGSTGLSPKRIYSALKKSGLQVFLVKDSNNLQRIFNYIPEENIFINIY